MTRLLAMVAILGLVTVSIGCAMPQTAPSYGGLVTMQVKGPVAGVDNTVQPTKEGTAQSQAIVFFSQGDASIKAAMEAGGITKVHHVDCEVFSILGLYSTYKTVVYGE